MIRLEVIGIPAPQGSKTRMPNGAMVDGSSKTGRAKLVEWRRAVADAARAHLAEHPRGPITGPVELIAWFRFPATASDPYRYYHTVVPDASKVLRATEDALVHGGLLSDDRIIATVTVCKRWCDHDEMPGADITITSLSLLEDAHRLDRKQRAAERRKAAKAAS